MEELKHFSHEHPLRLFQFQLNHNNENSDYEEDDEDKDKENDDFVVEDEHVGKCKMCKEEIYLFNLCYYSCKDCDYSMHKFCAELPITQQNHPLHPGHDLTLSQEFQLRDPDFKFIYPVDSEWRCGICKSSHKMFYNYHCSICKFSMDVICATMSKQNMDHPSHPHQLQRYFRRMMARCNACGDEHSGTFYHCTTCSYFMIHSNCALLPTKLLIQKSTNENFSHPHLLTLAYSFPYSEQKAKFFPRCRICEKGISMWIIHYRCNKCQYYVHVECATSKSDAFMSILMPAGLGITFKNFKDDDHPSLIQLPFPDESFNLLKHLFINKRKLVIKREIDGEMFSHPHPLILYETLHKESVSLHDPMTEVELLCDGCVRPITDVPFYRCSQHRCDFVLHEWCTRLPPEIQDHHDHSEHTLVLLTDISKKNSGGFFCNICCLPSNGFAYGCAQCEYYVDINCGFIPDVIEHQAHPNHLLLRCKASAHQSRRVCKACHCFIEEGPGFHCSTCALYLHTKCALLLPRTVRHKYDKHPLSLRYYPAENHSNEYFCEICEDEFDPTRWFYHCSTCDLSMHTACAPLKLHCEQSTFSMYKNSIFVFFNVKFGRPWMLSDHPHPVAFVQGIIDDGQCVVCQQQLQYTIIFKCSWCKFACHLWCKFSRHLNSSKLLTGLLHNR